MQHLLIWNSIPNKENGYNDNIPIKDIDKLLGKPCVGEMYNGKKCA